MAMNWPLMNNNITREDLDTLIEFLKQEDPILTQSKNVRAFESEWSQWLGVKYSVFVNSGASANLITMAAHHVAGDILHTHTGFHRDERAHARRVENASLTDHALARQVTDLHGQVRHRIERVGQHNKNSIRRMLKGFSSSLAHDLGIGLEQVFAAHAGLASNTSSDNNDV